MLGNCPLLSPSAHTHPSHPKYIYPPPSPPPTTHHYYNVTITWKNSILIGLVCSTDKGWQGGKVMLDNCSYCPHTNHHHTPSTLPPPTHTHTHPNYNVDITWQNIPFRLVWYAVLIRGDKEASLCLATVPYFPPHTPKYTPPPHTHILDDLTILTVSFDTACALAEFYSDWIGMQR